MMNLDDAISPTGAVEKLLTKGVRISERTLRLRARQTGAYRQVGNAMFFLPEDLERIMEPCNSSKDQNHRTGLRGEPLTVGASKEAHDAVTRMMHGNVLPLSSGKKRRTTSGQKV